MSPPTPGENLNAELSEVVIHVKVGPAHAFPLRNPAEIRMSQGNFWCSLGKTLEKAPKHLQVMLEAFRPGSAVQLINLRGSLEATRPRYRDVESNQLRRDEPV